jgi:hypothetical protein
MGMRSLGSLSLIGGAVILGTLGCSAEDSEIGVPSDDGAAFDTAIAFDSAPFDTATTEVITPDPSTVTVKFDEDDTEFLNPERGWMDGSGIALTDGASYEGIRTKNFALAYAKVRLDAYKTTSIPKSFLDALDAGFVRVRAAGIKVVLRFVYNDGTGGDASEAMVLKHIAELGPVVAKNIDAIAVWQGGFIGAWGEWHSSTNGLDNPTSRKRIIEAMLAALPKDRMVQIRTPHFKGEIWKDPTPLSAIFTGSNQARVGHHNDCFLASESDEGTYIAPIATWKEWLEKDVVGVPMGGESCRKNTLTACDNAQKELARFRWSFYNPFWHPDVYAQWGTEGCRDDIGKKLGYRLVLDEAAFAKAVAPGGVLPIKLKLRNVGYAPMFNPRPVNIVLDDGKTRHVATLEVDPRKWLPGGPYEVSARLRVPASAAIGNARLELWLPDASMAIALRPQYAVHIASKGVWDEKRGSNILTDALPIDLSAPGAVDPTAKDFVVIK